MTKENNLVENYTQNFHQYSLPILQVNTEISVVVWKLNKKSRKIGIGSLTNKIGPTHAKMSNITQCKFRIKMTFRRSSWWVGTSVY